MVRPPSQDGSVLHIACPGCGEQKNISGERRDGRILMTCGRCGETWERDTRPRCRLCGSDNLEYTPRPLWEKGRGDQHTPAGRFDAFACHDCGGYDVTSSNPRPGAESDT
jgi:hypothetical protein